MPTVKELKAVARAYGMKGVSRLRKMDLFMAIAYLRATEFSKRVQRAIITGRYPALQGDTNNPHRKWQRERELEQLYAEADASLRAKKYQRAVERDSIVGLPPLRRIISR